MSCQGLELISCRAIERNDLFTHRSSPSRSAWRCTGNGNPPTAIVYADHMSRESKHIQKVDQLGGRVSHRLQIGTDVSVSQRKVALQLTNSDDLETRRELFFYPQAILDELVHGLQCLTSGSRRQRLGRDVCLLLTPEYQSTETMYDASRSHTSRYCGPLLKSPVTSRLTAVDMSGVCSLTRRSRISPPGYDRNENR
jgi:hypothetical protein